MNFICWCLWTVTMLGALTSEGGKQRNDAQKDVTPKRRDRKSNSWTWDRTCRDSTLSLCLHHHEQSVCNLRCFVAALCVMSLWRKGNVKSESASFPFQSSFLSFDKLLGLMMSNGNVCSRGWKDYKNVYCRSLDWKIFFLYCGSLDLKIDLSDKALEISLNSSSLILYFFVGKKSFPIAC